jgi:hypothetical protein
LLIKKWKNLGLYAGFRGERQCCAHLLVLLGYAAIIGLFLLLDKEFATNQLYRDSFGQIDNSKPAHCYRISHGYEVPGDQANERLYLEELLTDCGGDKARAATMANISVRSLYRKMVLGSL